MHIRVEGLLEHRARLRINVRRLQEVEKNGDLVFDDVFLHGLNFFSAQAVHDYF